nr:unnamed protein product [Digitaria exilis]
MCDLCPVFVAGEVTSDETTKVVRQVVKEGDLDEEAIKAKFVDKDVSGKQAMDKDIGREAAELEDVKVDEEAMHARFEDSMKQYGRSYNSDEEKAR